MIIILILIILITNNNDTYNNNNSNNINNNNSHNNNDKGGRGVDSTLVKGAWTSRTGMSQACRNIRVTLSLLFILLFPCLVVLSLLTIIDS